jgi:soluble lytic murein transglycosylase-like protein
MYGMLSRAKRRYRVGNAAVSWTELMRAPTAAERWTWECVYPRPYAGRVASLEVEHAIPKGLVHALMRQESAFDPAVVSPASAVGLMQLMPSTAKSACGELSVDYDPSELTSPDYNLRLGAFYAGKLLKTFEGSVVLAAASYNAGPKAVSHWLASGADHDVDLFVARIPYDETRTYVAKVVGNLARYQWLAGGEAAVAALPLELPVGARCATDAY